VLSPSGPASGRPKAACGGLPCGPLPLHTASAPLQIPAERGRIGP